MNNQSEGVIRTWKSRDVALWLQEVGCGECIGEFRSRGVDGQELLYLTMATLKGYPSLRDAALKEKLRAAIFGLPGSSMEKAPLTKKNSGRRRTRRGQDSHNSLSPPPLPERPSHSPVGNIDEEEGSDEDDFEYDDDSFESDEEDIPPPLPSNGELTVPGTQAHDTSSIRQIEAKFLAFGLGGGSQLSALEQQYVDEYGDDGGDIYDQTPDGYLHSYSYPPEEECDDNDEDNIYDVPPEEAEGHLHAHPPPTEVRREQPAIEGNLPRPNATTTNAPQMRAPLKPAPSQQNDSNIGHASYPSPAEENPVKLSSPNFAQQRKMFEDKTVPPVAKNSRVNAPPSSEQTRPPPKTKPQFGGLDNKAKPFTGGRDASSDSKKPSWAAKPDANLKPSSSSSQPDSTSPRLPPRIVAGKAAGSSKEHARSEAGDEESGNQMPENLPVHLRDRFMKTKEERQRRKESITSEEKLLEDAPSCDAPQKNQLLQRDQQPKPTTPSVNLSSSGRGFKKSSAKSTEPPPAAANVSDKVKGLQEKMEGKPEPSSKGQSVKERMKMLAANTATNDGTETNTPLSTAPPPRSPAGTRWGGQGTKAKPSSKDVVDSGPALNSGSNNQRGKSRIEDDRPPLPIPKEAPKRDSLLVSAPPLPSRDTKPRASPVLQRAKMPIPTEAEEIAEEDAMYDPPMNHISKLKLKQQYSEDVYDPPQAHTDVIEDDTYDPPLLPSRIPPQYQPPNSSNRRVSEPQLPPRPPKVDPPKMAPPSSKLNKPSPKGDRHFSTPTKLDTKKPSPGFLESFKWYRGSINRVLTEAALDKEATDGCFVVRDPSKAEEKRLGYYSLSLWHGGKTRHLRIRRRNDKKYVVGESKDDERSFDTVADLIQHHKSTPLMLKSGGSTLLTCIPSA